jgi:DNA-binding response OmpR family regulator
VDLLLVEDDRFLANYLSRELSACGHEVTVAHDGHAGLRAVLEHKFDAVVLDRMLPQIDGLSVVRTLREDGITIPVIMVTALGQLGDRVDGLDGGADDYIVKPVDVDELNARLNALVRGRGWTVSETDTITTKDVTVSPARLRAWYRGVALDLPKLEFNLLAELVRNADSVLTARCCARRSGNTSSSPVPSSSTPMSAA